MDYDFFEEKNQAQNQPSQGEQKLPQRVPAPNEYNQKPPVRQKTKWWYVVVAISVAILSFFGGYVTHLLTLDGEMRTLLGVKKKIQKEYYQEITDKEFYDAVYEGINGKLLDAYSEYMTPEEFDSYYSGLQGNRSGVGLVFASGGSEGLKIVRVCGNSPAEAAGIKAGEYILGCGKTAETITPCATFDDFSDFLEEYEAKEPFFLSVGNADTQRTLRLSKQEYVESYVFYRTSTGAYTFTGENAESLTVSGVPMGYLPEDTAYIRLIEFSGNASVEFDKAMGKFKADGKKNLVLDLRGNGGGLLYIMQSISSYFCKTATERKPMVAVADYGERREGYQAYRNVYGEYFQADSRICVLADSGSASASECLLGAMIDYEAISYGDICLIERGGKAKTYGKGIMQQTFPINHFPQDALKLTVAEIRWPKSNHSIHGRGILPEDGATTVVENKDFEKETQSAIEKLLQ